MDLPLGFSGNYVLASAPFYGFVVQIVWHVWHVVLHIGHSKWSLVNNRIVKITACICYLLNLNFVGYHMIHIMKVLFELFLPCLLVNCHKQKEQENKSLSRQSNMEDPFNNKKK